MYSRSIRNSQKQIVEEVFLVQWWTCMHKQGSRSTVFTQAIWQETDVPWCTLRTDAEAYLGRIVTTLRNVLGLSSQAAVLPELELAGTCPKRFGEQYLMGEMCRELSFMLVHQTWILMCDEASDEPPSISNGTFTKIECNIKLGANYMLQGVMNVRIDLHNLPHTHLELCVGSPLTKKLKK